MSVTFFVDANRGAALKLDTSVAVHLLNALGYPLDEVAETEQITADGLLPRIAGVRLQFALGRGREFASDEVSAPKLLEYLDLVEDLAERARETGTPIVLI